MLNLEWSTEAVEALRYWRFHHPHPLVQLKMEVVLLHSQGVPNEQIQPICGISKATLYRVVYLPTADKYCRLTHQSSKGQKGLYERALMAS